MRFVFVDYDTHYYTKIYGYKVENDRIIETGDNVNDYVKFYVERAADDFQDDNYISLSGYVFMYVPDYPHDDLWELVSNTPVEVLVPKELWTY